MRNPRAAVIDRSSGGSVLCGAPRVRCIDFCAAWRSASSKPRRFRSPCHRQLPETPSGAPGSGVCRIFFVSGSPARWSCPVGTAAAWSYPCSSSTCCFLLNLFSSSGGAPLLGELAPRGGATLVQCANHPIACKNCPPKIPSEDSFSYYPRFMRGQSKAGSHVADACAAKHSSICSAVVLSSDSGGSSFRPK